MVKQVATEKEKKPKTGLVYDVLDRRWWAKYDVVSAPPHRKQLSDMHLFLLLGPTQEQQTQQHD